MTLLIANKQTTTPDKQAILKISGMSMERTNKSMVIIVEMPITLYITFS